MYHGRFRGTHYDIGYKWGSLLKKNNKKILDNIPYALSDDRTGFSHECVPYYQKYFPEILDEIKGIADGQNVHEERLQTVLFSMYCFMPSTHCSCFAVKNEHGLVLGRNSDFLTSIEKLYMNTIYNFSTASYSFNGNTTAFVEMEDGINQHGLAIGLTSVAPEQIQPGLNAGMQLRLFLETCRTIEEMIHLIKTLPSASSHTFIAADRLGDAALFECSPNELEIQKIDETGFVCSTNMFNTPKMKPHNNLPEDNWYARERYQNIWDYLSKNSNTANFLQAQELLSGKHGFTCQYDRSTGKDTVWSTVYNLKDGAIYRVEGNPSRRSFKSDPRKME